MGATLTATVFCEDRIIVAQVGDSRAYCLRNGTLFQISQDHSWVEEQVRAGVMSRADAENSPFKNVITRSVGAAPTVHPDFYEEQAQPGSTRYRLNVTTMRYEVFVGKKSGLEHATSDTLGNGAHSPAL